MRGRLLYGALAIALMVAVAGCDENLSDFTGPTPNLEPTFSSIQRDIFDSGDSSGRLACIQCHNAVGAFFSGLDLRSTVSYANLVGRPSRGKPSATQGHSRRSREQLSDSESSKGATSSGRGCRSPRPT